jgi:ABC-type transport system involved in cytochrome bd biosynthesis fused ATPase/permease subunit
VNPNCDALAFALKHAGSGDRRRLCAIGVAVCVLSVIGSLAPLALANLVAIAGNVHGEVKWASLYGVAVIAPTVLGFALQKTLLYTLSRLVERIRVDCIAVAVRAGKVPAATMSSGQLFSVVETDVERFDVVISALFVQVPQHITIVGSILLVVWLHQPAFGPWIVLFAIVLLVFAVVPKSRVIALTAMARSARERCNGQLDLFLSHARLLTTVGCAERSIGTVLHTIDAVRRTTLSANLFAQAAASTPQIALAMVTVGYLAAVVVGIGHSSIGLPYVLAVTIYLEQALSPIASLALTSARLHASLPSLHHVTECFGRDTGAEAATASDAVCGRPHLKLRLLSGATCETTLDSHKVWMAPNGAGKTTALMSITGMRESRDNQVFVENRVLSSRELESSTLYFDSQALGIWHRLIAGQDNIDCMLNVVRECIKRGNTPLFVCFDETLDRIAKSPREVAEFIEGLDTLGVVALVVTHNEQFRDCLISIGGEELRCT